jgi:2-methylcitrate dehydratase PrpD
VGLWKDTSAHQCGQFPFHLDLEALPSSLRVDDDAVHKRPEIVHQRSAVVLCDGMICYRYPVQHPFAPIDLGAELDSLDEVWELAVTAIKPYPVCHFIHGCADAAIELHADPTDIASVDAFLPHDTMPIVAEPAGAKISSAKFSAQFVVASCLLKGAFGLADLMPAALAGPAALDLTRACAIDPDTAFPAYFSGGVRVTLKDGGSLFRHIRINSGAGERALDEAAVSKKFLASAALTIPLAQAERIREAVLQLEAHSAAGIAALLRSSTD